MTSVFQSEMPTTLSQEEGRLQIHAGVGGDSLPSVAYIRDHHSLSINSVLEGITLKSSKSMLIFKAKDKLEEEAEEVF